MKLRSKDPPFCPPPLPFAIQTVDILALLADIEIGQEVSENCKKRLNAIHAHHKAVILRVKELLRAGQKPNEKRDMAPVKLFFRSDTDTSIAPVKCPL